jgi:O-antigen/teichoic acid export membrane protein
VTVGRSVGRPRSARPRSSHPAVLGLAVAVAGFLIAGAVGAVVGVLGGLAAARRPQLVLIAAASALFATAAFTVFEQPLDEANIPVFPLSYPLADFAAAIAAVLLLAGLAGIVASRSRGVGSPLDDGEPPRTATAAPSVAPGATSIVPRSTIAAVLACALLATLVLWQIGDQRWEGTVPGLAIALLGLAGVLALSQRIRSLPARRLVPMPGPMAILIGLRREHSHMLGGSAWLLAATLAVSLGSFAFWLLVTQQAPAEDVGRAAALFAASTFVCYLTSLGLPVAVSRYASDWTQGSATLFAWSLVLRIAASLAAVAVFVALAPESIREGLATWRPGFAWLVVFLLVAGQSVAELVDVRLMALRRWSLVFVRSLLIAVIRLPFLLFVPDSEAAFYLYVVALGGFALTGVAFLAPLARPGWLRLRPLPRRARRAVHFAGVNYLGQLAVQAPLFAVPFIVLVQVSAVENARFYLSWGVLSVVYISVQMIAQALLVEGGRGGADHRHQAAISLAAGLAVTAAATIASLGVGPLLASLYGPAYEPVATLLPLLVAGTIPFAVTMTLLTTARIREHSNATIAVAVGYAVAVLVPTVLLTGSDGVLGAAWGWTIGNAIAAGIALLASRLPGPEGRERARPKAETPLVTPIPGWQRGGRGQ